MASTTITRARIVHRFHGTLKLHVQLANNPSSAVDVEAVPNFAVFLDTHRDQPHVPSFDDDLHRGHVRPTPVHYAWAPAISKDGVLIYAGPETEKQHIAIALSDKHRFVTFSWWQDFISQYMFEHGTSPIIRHGDQIGTIPTRLLRDSHSKVYHMKSFRQIVNDWQRLPISR